MLTTDRICLQEIARQLNIAFDGDDDEQKVRDLMWLFEMNFFCINLPLTFITIFYFQMSTAASMQYFIDQLRQGWR